MSEAINQRLAEAVITIKNAPRGTYVVQLRCESFAENSIANIRKLWAIMFKYDNPEAVGTMQEWLRYNIGKCKAEISAREFDIAESAAKMRDAEYQIAVFGSVATPEQNKHLKNCTKEVRNAKKWLKEAKRDLNKAEKLQAVFTEIQGNFFLEENHFKKNRPGCVDILPAHIFAADVSASSS